MLIDYLLVIASSLSLGIQAWMGVRLTTSPLTDPKRLKRYELAFAVVGIIGFSAVVWGGYRNVRSAAHVETGVQRIETTVTKTGPKIDTQSRQIQTLQGQVTTQGEQLTALQTENGTLATQNGQLLAKNALMYGELQKIAKAAHLDAAPEGSAQQLADAIIERLSSVGQRVSALEHRDEATLYQGVRAVGKVTGITSDNKTMITFGNITSDRPLAFANTFYFQWAALQCAPVESWGTAAIMGSATIGYRNVSCKIIGKAP
jgi:hypothetical protein